MPPAGQARRSLRAAYGRPDAAPAAAGEAVLGHAHPAAPQLAERPDAATLPAVAPALPEQADAAAAQALPGPSPEPGAAGAAQLPDEAQGDAPEPPGGDAPEPPGGDAPTPPGGDAPEPPGGDAEHPAGGAPTNDDTNAAPGDAPSGEHGNDTPGTAMIEALPDHGSLDARVAIEGMVRGVNAALLGPGAASAETIADQTRLMLSYLAEYDFGAITENLASHLLASDVARLRLGLRPGNTPVPPDFTDDPAQRFAAIVRGCYAALLGRNPAELEIERWWEEKRPFFLQHGTAITMVEMIHHVVHSAEWNHSFRLNQMHLVRTELLPMPRGTGGIAVHISLGVTGYTSAMLRRFHRRRWSGPFDWISATPAMVREMLDDDFEQLLNPAAYAAVPLDERPDTRFYRCRHLGYEARHGVGCVLHAADMTEAAGQAYMGRCVERFRTSMRGLPSKLLIQVVPERADPAREFALTVRSLERYGRNFRFVMVSVLPEATTSPFPEIEPAVMSGAHRLLRMRTLGPIDGTDPADMLDEVVLLRGAFAAVGVNP